MFYQTQTACRPTKGPKNAVHKRCSKCPPFARTHAWRCFLHWSTAVSIMSCQKSDH